MKHTSLPLALRYVRTTLAAIVLVGSAGRALAQEPVAATPPAEGIAETDAPEAKPAAADSAFDLRTTKELTGDWGGARKAMADEGVTIKFKTIAAMMVNAHGGRETRNGHDAGGSYDFDVILDLEKIFDLKGATFLIRAKGQWGGEASDFDGEKIGGLFRTNADAGEEEPIFVDKWHYAQKLMDDRVEVRLGRLDIIKDLIDLSWVMGDEDTKFLNQALVRNATIPSAKALAAYVQAEVADGLFVRAIVADAQSQPRQTNFNTAFHDEDWFRVHAELGWMPEFESSRGALKGSYRVGGWYDPNPKQHFDNGSQRGGTRLETGDCGAYIGIDQMIYKEVADAKDNQGLSVAARYGWAPEATNRIEHFWAVAMAYEGLIPERDKDVLGIGVAQGILSSDYRDFVAPTADRETVFEMYYSWHVTPWLTISPDFQFIANPGGRHANDDATVAGLRVRMQL